MNYQEWLTIWLANYVKPVAKARTYANYARICSSHIAPHLGGYDLAALGAKELQAFITALLSEGNRKTGGGLSPNFVGTILSVVQSSLRTAHLLGYAPTYAGDKLKRPKLTAPQVACFTVDEQKRIEQAVFGSGKDKLFGIVLCLYTGLRIGELLALTWEDIDFAKRTLSITKTCYDGTVNGKYGRIIDTPKTPHSRRLIPIPRQLMPLLKAQKKRSRSAYLIANGEKPILLRSYQRTFELLLKRLNIPHKGFHALRHTFATRALECGMDVKTLSELLGHTNATITLNRYVHSLMEHKTEMMNRLGKLL